MIKKCKNDYNKKQTITKTVEQFLREADSEFAVAPNEELNKTFRVSFSASESDIEKLDAINEFMKRNVGSCSDDYTIKLALHHLPLDDSTLKTYRDLLQMDRCNKKK